MATALEQIGQVLAQMPGKTVFVKEAQPHGDPAYISGFVKECCDRGVPEAEASVMLHRHLLEMACEADPSFGRGFARLAGEIPRMP